MIDCAKHNLTMIQFACFLLCIPVTEARENVDDQFAISFGVAFDWLSVARVIIGDAKRRREKLNSSNAHLFFFSSSLPVLQKSTFDFKLVLLSSGVQR